MLRIGQHLVKAGADWAIDIPASDTKSKRPLEFPLSPELSARIDFYLREIRSGIPGAEGNDHLWVNRCGPMSDKMIYTNVRRQTQKALGFPVNLHRFRHAAATFWSVPGRSRQCPGRQGPARSRNIRHNGTDTTSWPNPVWRDGHWLERLRTWRLLQLMTLP